MLRIALIAVAFLAASGARAQVYKCVDSGGKIVYSQIPCPPNMKSGTMSRGGPSAPAAPSPASPADNAAKGDAAKSAAPKAAAPKTAAEQEQAFRKRQQDQAKAAKESGQNAEEAQRKAAACRNARERLAQYEIGGRLSRINAQGERYYLEDAQVEQEKAQARADIARACN